MQFTINIFAAAVLATFVSASPAAQVKERQLSGLPSVVCLTGALSGALPADLDVVACAADETCTALDIPIVGSLLPIGVSPDCFLLSGRYCMFI